MLVVCHATKRQPQCVCRRSISVQNAQLVAVKRAYVAVRLLPWRKAADIWFQRGEGGHVMGTLKALAVHHFYTLAAHS